MKRFSNSLDNTLSQERKVNRVIHKILLRTVYRNKSGQWVADYYRKHHVFHHMGKNCYYQDRSLPSDAHLVSIHDNVLIAGGVKFITHDRFSHLFNSVPEYRALLPEGKTYTVHFETIEIFDNVSVGGQVIIMPGVKIGPNAIVAGGSVVTKDVPEGVIVGGNPAKVIGKIEDLARRRANHNDLTNWDSPRRVFEEHYWGNVDELDNF